MHLWPFIEQTALADQNDLSQPFYLPPGTIGGTMNGLCGQRCRLIIAPATPVRI